MRRPGDRERRAAYYMLAGLIAAPSADILFRIGAYVTGALAVVVLLAGIVAFCDAMSRDAP